jgi:hypothetical protein
MVHPVDPANTATRVTATAPAFNIRCLVLFAFIGMPFCWLLNTCAIGCYGGHRRGGTVFLHCLIEIPSFRFRPATRGEGAGLVAGQVVLSISAWTPRAVGGGASDGDRRPMTTRRQRRRLCRDPSAAKNARGATLLPCVASMCASQSGAWLPSVSRRAESMHVCARHRIDASDNAHPTPFRRWAITPATPPVRPRRRQPP